MADVVNRLQRSYNMSRIKGRNTKPEIKLRKILSKNGLRGYRIHYNISGKPDIVFPRKKFVIFLDGCFWHRCPSCFIKPETHKSFWEKKITGNAERDKKVTKTLKSSGWKVMRLWEHEIRKNPDRLLARIIRQLRQR